MTLVSERVLEALLETALDYAIIALDRNGLVTSWSEGAHAIFGWSSEDMLGRPASTFFTREDCARGVPQAEMEAALVHGRGNDERWHLRRDGTCFWASGEMLPLRDKAGGVHGFLKILRDRTAQRLADERQRADSEFLRSVLAASGDCIKVLDLDGGLQFMSEGGQRAMEVSDFNAVRGCNWPETWRGSGHVAAMQAMQAAREGGVGRFQGEAPTFAGTPRFWDVQITPILDAQGRPERLLAVSRDLTAVKRAETELREAQTLNSLILESSRDAIVVMDLDGNTQFVSPGGLAAMEITDPASLVGQPWSQIWQSEQQAVAQTALVQARAGAVGRFEGYCPTHKGSPKWWDIAVSALPGPDGHPARLVAVGRDVTVAREAQQRLLRSEERLQLALGASTMVGIYDVDLLAGTIYGDANFARLHGIDPAQAAAGAPVELIFRSMHADDAAEVRAQLARLIGGADSLHLEHRLTQADGSHRWVVARGRLVRNEAGVPVRLPGALVDVTEQREAEQRQGLLMQELAHRVKNTLAVVHSLARQTLRGEGAMAEARDAFGARLLALSAAHDVLMQGSWTQAGLRNLVEAAAQLHAPPIDGRARLTIEGPEVTLGSQAALSVALVLHELGTNAVKYGALSSEAGHVEVRWSVEAGQLSFLWAECGGPVVAPPSHRGFGSRLIERSLSSELQAQVVHAYAPTGVTLTLQAQLAALQRSEG